MGSRILVYGGGAMPLPRRCCRIMSSFDAAGGGAAAVTRWQVLEQVDKELSKGNERAALNLIKDSQTKPDGLRCFGAARQIPQRLYTLDELRLNGIETTSLLSPVDTTLGSIERAIQAAALLGGIAAYNVFDLSPPQIFFASLGLLFLWTLDAVSFNGGISFLVLDTLGHSVSQKYHNRVVQHEAGHFLIAYLLGILPKGYSLTSLDALTREGSLNVQAGTAFVDFEFLDEVSTGKVSANTLNKFTCIALAGVVTEYLLFRTAEGGLSDINTVSFLMINSNIYLLLLRLDRLLKSVGFTQKKTDGQVRWAVLNTVLILRRHENSRARLADAMSQGKSVGSCVQVIEDTIDTAEL